MTESNQYYTIHENIIAYSNSIELYIQRNIIKKPTSVFIFQTLQWQTFRFPLSPEIIPIIKPEKQKYHLKVNMFGNLYQR